MAGMGPPPKPAHLRQRANKKAGATTLPVVDIALKDDAVPEIPNPDGRDWKPLTLEAWRQAWKSPMALRWLTSDVMVLGRLAILWDEFYKLPDSKALAEIRLQEQRFGLSPLDRSRLQWELVRGDEAEEKQKQGSERPKPRTPIGDPRSFLKAAK